MFRRQKSNQRRNANGQTSSNDSRQERSFQEAYSGIGNEALNQMAPLLNPVSNEANLSAFAPNGGRPGNALHRTQPTDLQLLINEKKRKDQLNRIRVAKYNHLKKKELKKRQKLANLKRPKKFQIDKDKLMVGLMEEIPEEDEIINEPLDHKTKFAEFMRNNINTHPAQDEVISFLNQNRTFNNEQQNGQNAEHVEDVAEPLIGEEAPAENNAVPHENNVDLEQAMTAVFNTQLGRKVYQNFESPLKKLIQQGAGNRIPGYTQAAGIRWLAMAADQDYAAKGLLSDIVLKPMDTKWQASKRLFEYKQFIQFIGGRLGNYRLEDLAIKTNLINRVPKYLHTDENENRKRAYETDEVQEDDAAVFNPNHDPELNVIQTQIDAARTPQEAYRIFAAYTGNPGGKMIDPEGQTRNLELQHLKNKLKHMTRVVLDYPELRNNIGDMEITPKDAKDIMGTTQTVGLHEKAAIMYNAFKDSNDPEGIQKRNETNDKIKNGNFSTGLSVDTVGTHELGHVLTSTLNDEKNSDKALDAQFKFRVEADLIDSVLKNRNVISKADYEQLDRHEANGLQVNGRPAPKGQIVMWNNKFKENNHTSIYGIESPGEFIGEAFHDVYSHGSSARKMSIEVVKEYEARQKKLTKERFFRKKAGFFEKIMNWFRMW